MEIGDTVMGLSSKFGVPVCEIIRQNLLKKEVEVGDLLFIERSDKTPYIVKPCDTLENLAKKFGVTKQSILVNNGVEYLFYGLVVYI